MHDEGEFELQAVEVAPGAHVFDYSSLLPHAPWFWERLSLHCDPGCCGIEAYAFSHRVVRWVCGDDVKLRGRKKRMKKDRPQWQTEAIELATELRDVAAELRTLDEPSVWSSKVFTITATPENHAELIAKLADWLEHPLAA